MSGEHRVQMDRVTAMTFALPDTTVRTAHGAPEDQIRGKTFCRVQDHDGSGRTELWVKGVHGAQQEWVTADSLRYCVPAYVGPTGCIGAWLDVEVDWPAVAVLLVDGYLIQAGVRVAAGLDPAVLVSATLTAT